MPTYNGGLFSQETDSGRFLATYAIPDGYLALGLDRLTRDVDDRTKALVFIDFKSLGVRHLGSIYEGLLEFKLQIAREELAVTKEKGKEVYKPAEQVKKPLATIDTGEVYSKTTSRSAKRPVATTLPTTSSNTSCGIPLARCWSANSRS
jgi:hypothetical protein